jgi:hypothetical protein
MRNADMYRSLMPFLAGLVIGGVLTTIAGLQYLEYRDIARRSSVDHPLNAMLQVIASDVRRQDLDLAARRAELLAEGWQAYLAGGPTPEAFISDVMSEPIDPSVRHSEEGGETP